MATERIVVKAYQHVGYTVILARDPDAFRVETTTFDRRPVLGSSIRYDGPDEVQANRAYESACRFVDYLSEKYRD